MQVVRSFVARYRNVGLVAAAVAAGLLAPGLGSLLSPLVTPLVIFLVYSSLRGLHLEELDVASYALLVALSLGISYGLVPAVGIQLVGAFLADGALVGFAIALSVPTTAGSAIIWTRFSRGDVQLATTISIVSLLVAPVATPVVLTALVGAEATVPVTSILVDLLVIIVGGGLLAVVVPASAVSTRTVDVGATLAILLLIYTSVAGAEPAGLGVSTLVTIVGVSVLLVGFGLAVALLCERGFGLERLQTLPLFFTSSLKNLGIALLIAFAYADSLVVIAIITYYVTQQVAGALLADVVRNGP